MRGDPLPHDIGEPVRIVHDPAPVQHILLLELLPCERPCLGALTPNSFARFGRFVKRKPRHQGDRHFIARAAHDIPESPNNGLLVEGTWAKFSDGASIGKGLQPLRLDERSVEIEDRRSDHALSAPKGSGRASARPSPETAAPRRPTFGLRIT